MDIIHLKYKQLLTVRLSYIFTSAYLNFVAVIIKIIYDWMLKFDKNISYNNYLVN